MLPETIGTKSSYNYLKLRKADGFRCHLAVWCDSCERVDNFSTFSISQSILFKVAWYFVLYKNSGPPHEKLCSLPLIWIQKIIFLRVKDKSIKIYCCQTRTDKKHCDNILNFINMNHKFPCRTSDLQLISIAAYFIAVFWVCPFRHNQMISCYLLALSRLQTHFASHIACHPSFQLHGHLQSTLFGWGPPFKVFPTQA